MKVVDIGGMFFNCKKLKRLNLSSFNTNNANNLDEMFKKCNNLKELDISSFNFTKDKKISDMFWGCINLEKIKVSSDYSEFFTNNKKSLFKKYENINIIFVSKLDRTINSLFY